MFLMFGIVNMVNIFSALSKFESRFINYKQDTEYGNQSSGLDIV